MRRIKPTLWLALAMASCVVALVLMANMLGLVPDDRKAELEARAKVAEALAVQITGAMQRQDQPAILETLDAVVERNSDVLSIAVRDAAGKVVVSRGEHESHWQVSPSRQSTPTHIFVPVSGSTGPQGQIEMAFVPLARGASLYGVPHSLIALIAFVAGLAFLFFFFMLRRTIKQLDPGKVMPERVRRAFDTLSEGVMLLDERERILLVNDAFVGLLGETPKEGLNVNRLAWRMPDGASSRDDAGDGGYAWRTALAERREVRDRVLSLRTREGIIHELSAGAAPIEGDNGKVIGAIVTLRDVTVLRRSEEALAKTATQLAEREAQMQRQTQELEYLTSHDSLSGCLNRRTFLARLERLLGAAAKPVALLVAEIDGFDAIADAHGPAVTDRLLSGLGATLRAFAGDAAMVARHRGEEFVIALEADAVQAQAVAKALAERVAAEALLPGHEPVTVSVGIGVSRGPQDTAADLIRLADRALDETAGERRRTSALPARVANPEVADTTGANERAAFDASLARALARAQASQQPFAMLRMRLGSGEYLREALGDALTHGLLEQVGHIVRAGLREQDGVLVNREAGELVVHLGDLEHADDVAFAIARLAERLRTPIALGGRDVYVAAKVGAALFPDDGHDVATLGRHAGVALTRALEDGELDSVRFYEAAMVQSSEWRMNVESGIRQALANDEFELFFQPIVCAKSGAVAAAEALLRCNNAQLADVRIDQIIDVAEQSNLSTEVDEWVIRRGLAQMQAWCEAGLALPKISLNVSARQLCNAEFMDRIFEAFREVRFSPTRIQIEVTETARVADIAVAAPHLKRLQSIGVQIAIDDFGTGQASLTYIQRLHPDTIKLDKSFADDVTSNHANATLVAAMTVMAHCLGVEVVVEGVEHAEQMAFLAETGCDEIQGYHISRPMPEAAMAEWLAANVAANGTREFVATMRAPEVRIAEIAA